jgi:hypothetical protein
MVLPRGNGLLGTRLPSIFSCPLYFFLCDHTCSKGEWRGRPSAALTRCSYLRHCLPPCMCRGGEDSQAQGRHLMGGVALRAAPSRRLVA